MKALRSEVSLQVREFSKGNAGGSKRRNTKPMAAAGHSGFCYVCFCLSVSVSVCLSLSPHTHAERTGRLSLVLRDSDGRSALDSVQRGRHSTQRVNPSMQPANQEETQICAPALGLPLPPPLWHPGVRSGGN